MEKQILEGVLVSFGKEETVTSKNTVKIDGRNAIPNYFMCDFRTKRALPPDYTEDMYNQEYIKHLNDAIELAEDFMCGNISDSSEILKLSVEDDFSEYVLTGLFKP